MEKSEEIGYHKGALATLSKEHQELLRLLQITEHLIKAHVSALKELGIDLEEEARKAQEKTNLDDRAA